MTQNPQPGTAPARRNPFLQFLIDRWVAIVLVIVAILFIAQNQHTVRIGFLWLSLNGPLWVTLALVLLAGVLIGYFSARRSKKAEGARN